MGGRRSSRSNNDSTSALFWIIAGLISFLAVLFITIGTIICFTQPAQTAGKDQTDPPVVAVTKGDGLTPNPAATDAQIEHTPSPAASPDMPYVNTRLNDASAENPEVVAWITIAGTAINYPVVQAVDNKFYLTHNAQRQGDIAGAIFMDYRNDRSYTFNTILYGHDMKNGSMFKALMGYKNKKFYDEHKIIELATPSGMMRWEIFSVYVTDTNFYYIQTDFSDNDEWKSFLQQIQEKSMYDTGITLTEEDTVLTLSTCTYEFDNARFVVQAHLLPG